nr:hypothetical protein CFP56_16375 [Quercus suber]
MEKARGGGCPDHGGRKFNHVASGGGIHYDWGSAKDLNKETVAHFNVQRRMGKESVSLESQISTQSTSKNKEVIMPNSGRNDSKLHAATGVIDHTIDDASPTLEGSDMVTNKVPNSGVLNTNPIMNAYPVETIVMERKSITLETTLAASTHEHHVTINLDKKTIKSINGGE